MAVSIRREGDLAIVTIDNPPVNALSRAVRQGLFDAVTILDNDVSVSGVLLVCAGRTFIAGADVNEFSKPPLEPHLRDVVAAIESAKTPWVAVIHGTALGGGFEIAMGCRFRVALKDAKIGFPEVTLGLIPGAGGTVRTPRLAGVVNAVTLVTTGRAIGATQALAIGLIDAVVAGDLLLSAAAFAHTLLAEEWPLPARTRPVLAPTDDDWVAIEQAVRKAARGEDAPLRALASIRFACTTDFDSALAFERDMFLALRGSPQAAALRAVFFAERTAPRPPELAAIEPRSVKSVAVIGDGLLGAEIVAALRDGGFPVILIEHDQAALDRSFADVKAIVDEAVQGASLTADSADERIAGISTNLDYDTLTNTDFVIEAVAEDLDVKRSIISRLTDVCRPDTILATTSTSLDPRMIAENLAHKDRFIGLHFFRPAQLTKLLEVVPVPETSPHVLAAAFALARSLNKIPVQAGIGEGFIGNRLLTIMYRQAERVVLAGVSPTDVDNAMREFGFAMGPFEAQNRIGPDAAALRRRAAHENDTNESGGVPQQALNQNDIVHALLFPVVNEGSKILAEDVAKRATDIDLVAIHACGFPRRCGGPMHFATAHGLKAVVNELDRIHAMGLAAPPCGMLRRAASEGDWPAAGS